MIEFRGLCSDPPSTTDVHFIAPYQVLLKNVNAFSAHQLYVSYVDTKYARHSTAQHAQYISKRFSP